MGHDVKVYFPTGAVFSNTPSQLSQRIFAPSWAYWPHTLRSFRVATLLTLSSQGFWFQAISTRHPSVALRGLGILVREYVDSDDLYSATVPLHCN